MVIQKLRRGTWVNVGQTSAQHTSKGYSRYSKRIRQKRGGRYRVVVWMRHGAHSPRVSKSIKRRQLRL